MNDHKKLMKDLEMHFKPVLNHSKDGVYLWLDEHHMICNEKMAKMFGYKNSKELCRTIPFLDKFVARKDQSMFSKKYHSHIASLSSPTTFKFHGIKKDGKTALFETDMIPMTFMGHAIAYHFVRKK